MVQPKPQKTSRSYRGTVEEVFSHRDEIPPGSIVQLTVLVEASQKGDEADEEQGAFGGKSLLEAFPDLFGTEHSGPSNIAEHADEYMRGFGETKDRRKLQA